MLLLLWLLLVTLPFPGKTFPMRILHVTYARVNDQTDPHVWLENLNFFTGIPEEMSKVHSVESIHLINYTGILQKKNVRYHFLRISLFDWMVPFRLSRYIVRRNADVIIVHGLLSPWQLIWLTRNIPGATRIYVQHHAETVFRFPKNILHRLVGPRISGYFFSSIDLATPWIEAGQIGDSSKVHEVIELSSPFCSRERGRVNDVAKRYLWVGRFDENKDPVTLVRAFLQFLRIEPEATLNIVFRGGHLLHEIENLLRDDERSTRICLVGAVDRQDIEAWYLKSAFIISTSGYESAGAAVCEGMSCGCIPILTDIPSFRTLTASGKVGLLFKTGSVNDLLDALTKSTRIDIPTERGKVLDQFKSNLSFEAISKKILQVIECK